MDGNENSDHPDDDPDVDGDETYFGFDVVFVFVCVVVMIDTRLDFFFEAAIFFDLDSRTDDFSETIGKIIFTGRFLKNLKLMHEFGGGGGGGGFGGSEDAFATIGCNPSWNIK